MAKNRIVKAALLSLIYRMCVQRDANGTKKWVDSLMLFPGGKCRRGETSKEKERRINASQFSNTQDPFNN